MKKKIKLDMKKETESQRINRLLKEQGRTKTWLAEQIGIEPNSLYRKLSKNQKFSVAQTKIINSSLSA